MRIHFSAALPCLLRLDGANAGCVGEAEQFADLCPPGALAEFLPADGDYVPLAFMVDETFFRRPPACADVYRSDCCADIYAARFCTREVRFTLLAQGSAAGLAATAFDAGTPLLLLEGGGVFATHPLPRGEYDIGEERIGGERFVRAFCRCRGGSRLLLFSEEGKPVLDERADSYEGGKELCLRARIADIAGHTQERRFCAEKGVLRETARTARPRDGYDPDKLPEAVLPFAFFQAMAAGGDLSPYLSAELLGQREELAAYLGDFCAVRLPKEVFYLTHEGSAAGLTYRAGKNLFDVRWFAAELRGRKIENIRPVGGSDFLFA